MNSEAMQALLAGWLSGAAAGLAVTGVVLVMAARHPALAPRLPWQRHLGVLGIVVANGMLIVLTLVGLLLGALYHRTREDAERFPLWVILGLFAVGGLYFFVRGRVRTAEAPVVLVALAIAGVAFAGLLPRLASA